jgi:hypothetical protein
MRAAVLINAGVCDLAAGRSNAVAQRLDKAWAIIRDFEGDLPSDAVTWSLM